MKNIKDLKNISLKKVDLSKHQHRLNAKFYIILEDVKKTFSKFNNQFNCKKFEFSEKFERVYEFENKVIEIKPFRGTLSFKIVSEKSSTYGVYFKTKANNIEVSLEQLTWYLNNEEVINYLAVFSGGTVVPKLNITAINELLIPVSTHSISKRNNYKVNPNSLNPYRTLLSKYITEFQLTYSNRNYFASTSLAGSLCELILYQLLIEQESITEDMLSQKGLGTYIQYSKMLSLSKNYGFSITPFERIKKIRNKLVHPSNAINEITDNVEELIKSSNLKKNVQKIVIEFGIN